jgi:hypothetical protein
MSNVLRLVLFGVFAVWVYVVELGAWGFLRSRRLREGRGDIRNMPFAWPGEYGLPWPYAAVALLVGAVALVVFMHG